MSHFARILELMLSYAPRLCIESEGDSCTYDDVVREIGVWRGRFDAFGIEAGCSVGIRADYSVSAVAALFALFDRRAVAALIPRDRDPDRYLSDARTTGFLDLARDGHYEWRSLPQQESHPLLDRLRAAGDGGIVLFTSGSTGYPKAALQSLEGFLYKFRRPGRSLRTLAFLLFDHVAGLDTLLYTVSNGGALILARQRDPQYVLALIESRRVEVLPTSPSFLRMLCLSRGAHTHDVSSLKIITYGSEPMDANTLSRVNRLFPNAQIIQKYGTTETGSPRTVSRANDSLWLKIKKDGVETKIVDDILWIRSEGAMLGYLNADSTLDDLGWYCTGDLVQVDGEWIRFLGRAVDIINVGGEKVAPAEVEQTLLALDIVSHALVSGTPHALMGQVVMAKVGLADASVDHGEAVKRIRQHCRERLAPYKVPVKIEVVTERFENDRQKVRRQAGTH
jgi:long-chain acyl-CoA synthetase